MVHRYTRSHPLRRLYSLIAILLGSGTLLLHAQTTIAQQDFETAPATPVWTIGAGGTNISTATGSGDIPANQRIRGGARSWQVSSGSATLDLASVSTLGYTNMKAMVRISSTSVNNNNGADANDAVRVFTALSGGAFPATADITVSSTGNNARWSYNNAQNAITNAGTPLTVNGTPGTDQGTIYSTLVVNIPNGTTSVALRVSALNNQPQEVWNIDDITLTGTQTPTLTATAPTDFGTQCVNTITGPNTLTITGYFLTTANVTVGPLTGYRFSSTPGGLYGGSISLSHPAGSYTQTIYVRFQPTTTGSFNGNIPVGGGGATAINVPVTGEAISGAPVVTSSSSNSPICTGETLSLNVNTTGSALTLAWSGSGTITGGNTANASVAGATTGTYTILVTNACGSASQGLTVAVNPVSTWYADADNDGSGDPNNSVAACPQPSGFVANNTDGCPSDPAKTSPGICGCSIADTDTDGDGTANCNDGCPNDPNKVAPGTCGCGTPDTDSDLDGLVDCNDGCPNDPLKLAPGACGCGTADTDTDLDGTADCNDGCPIDPLKIVPGQCGCDFEDIDTDADGLADCIDGCPTDSTKVAPGICGCETPDDDTDADGIADCIDPCPNSANNSDTDADGTPDCLDLCPNDPAKIYPGTCGCGAPETDSDADTYADCADACPNDPWKIAPGLCGCGVPEVDTDGDTYFDCVDACPNDPLKIGPGTCGCGVADTDTDNDGTLDCNDGCPTDGTKTAPGTCGCGVPDTDTDSDGIADCVDSCPMLVGSIGDACDDGDVNTTSDVISASCTCTGISVITCSLNDVQLFIRTDGQASQTSWVIETLNGGTPMCSGSSYANNTNITVPCCIPNGSYALRVMDSFGDGMGNGAGYVLRMADGRRIIDNEYGCSFTVMSSVAQGFTLPLSSDRITSLYCDREDLMPSDFIRAVPNAAVSAQLGITNATSGYGFWLFDPDGGYSRRINITHATNNWWFPSGPERATFLKLSSITTNPIPTDQYLNVRVRTLLNGVTGAYGPACRFRIDLLGNCPTTSLVNDVNDPMHSCGISGVVINGSRTLHVAPVSAANKYQWEFTSGTYLRRITSTGSGLNLAPWATNPLEYGKTYGVRVRVSFDNGVTYCPFGPVCSISTAGSPSANAGRNADLEDRSAALAMWPNPNSDGALHLTIDDLGMHLETAELVIYDMTGRRVHNERIAVNGESLNTVSTLPDEMGPGVYLVSITAGERSYVKRLVIR